MRVLGLDIGSVRIGVAASDERGRMAHSVSTVAAQPAASAVAAIATIARERRTERIVIGLPLELDGREGRTARRVRAFAARLSEAGLGPIEWQDERMSSAGAERAMIEVGARRDVRRSAMDRVAATWILQAWLDTRRTESGE